MVEIACLLMRKRCRNSYSKAPQPTRTAPTMVGGLAVPISARLPFAASVAYTWLVCLADSRMTNVECNLINCTCENKQLSDILSASGAQIIKAQLPGDDENVLAFSLCGGISVDNAKTVIPGELSPQCEAELSKEAPVMMRVDSGTGHCVLTNSSGRAATATVAVSDSPGGHSAKLEMRFLCEPPFTVTVELAQNVPLDKQICKPIGSPKFLGDDNCLEWDATIGAEGKQLVQCAAPTIPPAPGPGPDSNTDDSGLTTTQIVAICLSAVVLIAALVAAGFIIRKRRAVARRVSDGRLLKTDSGKMRTSSSLGYAPITSPDANSGRTSW